MKKILTMAAAILISLTIGCTKDDEQDSQKTSYSTSNASSTSTPSNQQAIYPVASFSVTKKQPNR